MAFDHGPRHTMTVCSRFWLSRPTDRDAFTAAVTRVARDNPLLAVKSQGGSWLPIPFDPDRQIDWGGTSAMLRHLSPDDMLVRWSVRAGSLRDLGLSEQELTEEGLGDAQGMLVVLRYPHAIADALGAVAMMRQVCGILAGCPVASPTRDDLEERRSLGRTPWACRRTLRHQLARIARCFCHRPAEFTPDHPVVPEADVAEIACERVVASAAATTSLLVKARAARVSVNDVLLTALFRTLTRLMDRRAVVRIAVPTSLRSEGNQAFCNQVSMVFLDRDAARAADGAALLRGVSAEMTHIKRLKLGHAMHMCLGILHRAGIGVLWSATQLPLVWATAVLSNLGNAVPADEAASGAIRIVAHDALPPLRPGTSLAILAVGHGGRLGLTIRYAPDRVSAERALHVLECTLAEAVSLLGDAVPERAAAVKPR